MIRRHRYRRWFPALLACGALAATGPATAAPAHAPTADPVAVVDAAVIEDVAGDRSTSFWVMLDSQADLSAAGSHAEFVYEAKTTHAERTQKGLRALLTERGSEFSSFWMDNSLLVTGDRALVDELAARPEVAAIEADTKVTLPRSVPTTQQAAQPAAGTTEWNIDRINAPDVWDLGVRGEGVVVAALGHGAAFDHPALVGSYRGARPDGRFDHDYNWFDPGGDCDTEVPCDSSGGHGTHTVGTMVGVEPLPDGAQHHIGVAPGARWIATTGCRNDVCLREDVLSAGQWVLAPTDGRGENPRPDLAPDVVNNAWLSDLDSDWYRETVRSWVAAGIFPVFAAAGHDGCGTIGAPASHPESYTVGAFDQDNEVPYWSGSGSALEAEIKPDIVAPGASIRSAGNTGDYILASGTSMAAAHVAGTVALMWSHTPSLRGDLAATRAALGRTAIDLDDLSCGGTVERNYTAGEGRLDAFAAVTANPRGHVGSLAGRVTSAGAAVNDARVTVTGPQTDEVTSGADGAFRLPRLLEGEYTVAVRAFGHEDLNATVTVVRDTTVTSDHALVRLPHATVTGTVGAGHEQAPGATVRVAGATASTTVDDTGGYRLELPLGQHELVVEHPDNNCLAPVNRQVDVTGDTTVAFTLPDRVDGYGYRCRVADDEWVGGTTKVASIPEAGARMALPFPVPLYGKTYRNMWLHRYGMVSLADEPTDYWSPRFNLPVPSADRPNATLFPLWDHWWVPEEGGVYTGVVGTAPNRTFVIEWRDVRNSVMFNQFATFAALLGEDGTISYRYGELTGTRAATGTGATIGLEDATGTTGFQYSLNESAVHTGKSITFSPGDSGLLRGTVTDGNDDLPVGASTVILRREGATVATDTTGADGRYVVQAPPGEYELTVAAERYETTTVPVTIERGGVLDHPAALRTPKVAVLSAVDWVVPAGQTRQRSVVIGNTGTIGTDIAVAEATDVPWLTVTSGTGRAEPGERATVTVALDAGQLAAGTVHRAELEISSGSARTPRQTVPVTIVMPLHQFAVDAGGATGRVDSLGDTWVADQPYRSGSFGYVESGRSKTRSTSAPIAGTNDPARFQTQREGMYEYQFDGLTPGTYTVELEFAELTRADPGDRVFDVIAENVQILPNLDLARLVGGHAALSRTATVRVTDGSLDLRFAEQAGDGHPIVSAVRVSHRPDLP